MVFKFQTLFVLSGVLTILGCKQKADMPEASTGLEVFVGAYTARVGPSGEYARGISRLSLDASGGMLAPAIIDSGLVNPSFLTLSSDQRYLYVVEETGPESTDSTGHVRAYAGFP